MPINKLIVESDSDPYTNSPTGVGFVDLECGGLRFCDSNTIKFSASGSADKKNAYLTAHTIPILQSSPLPQLLPVIDSDVDYYYLAGLNLPLDVALVNYPPGSIIPVNYGNTITSNNEVDVIDVNGDGSAFRFDTPGMYRVLIQLSTNSINDGVVGILLNGSLVPYSSSIALYNRINTDCVIKITTGDIISLSNVGNTVLEVEGTFGGRLLYSTVLFERFSA